MRLEPRGHQREVLYLPQEGHHVVLGSAGSGKSTVAVLRSQFLADPALDHSGRVLLVTHTRALTNYLAQLVGPTGPNVDVLNLHEVGKRALVAAGARPLYHTQTMKRLQRGAVNAFKAANPSHRLASRPQRFFSDEFAWIAGHGIETETDYLAAERIGRGSARLLRADRQALYLIYRRYLAARSGAGYDFDLQDMPHQLHLGLQNGSIDTPYRHVVIDEAQDFAPEVMRAATLLVSDSGSVTVFADYAQQIYGQRMSWRSAGLRISKLWQLTGNYRNTRQIAAVASAIAASPGFEAEDLIPPSDVSIEGPIPILLRCRDDTGEDRWVSRQASEWARTGSVAVLCRSYGDKKRLEDILPAGSIRLDRTLTRLEPKGMYFGTLHNAKGLEFDAVVIPRCTANRLPDPDLVEADGEEEARAEDLRLLYVGVTRARRHLAISYHGEPSALIPNGSSLFERRSL